jgi:uncharacterized protein YjbJ (UPF0337 family)
MNWDQVEGKWKQYKGQLRTKWGKLTDSDLDVIQGNRQQLVGKIQEYYGVTKENAEKQIEDFVTSLQVSQAAADEQARRAGQR